MSAYTLPRFSVDCDLVVKDMKIAKRIVGILQKRGFSVVTKSQVESKYEGSFMRLEKIIEGAYKLSFDLLVECPTIKFINYG